MGAAIPKVYFCNTGHQHKFGLCAPQPFGTQRFYSQPCGTRPFGTQRCGS